MPTTTDTKPLSEQTPAEIDTVLFDLWVKRFSLANNIQGFKDRIAYLANDRYYDRECARVHERLVEAEQELADVQAAIAPLEAEYSRRGGWARYFLVCNKGGHLHTSRECSTCYPTTEFALVAQSSGLDEEQLIETFATVVCSVCFPNAPSSPAYARGIERARAAQAERDADICPGSGVYVPGTSYGARWVNCSVCGSAESTTGGNGRPRKHRSPEAIERDLQADPKKLPRSLWFKNCGGYTVDTTAGAKTALREASALRTLHKLPWQGGGEERLSAAYHGARAALVSKGFTQEEIDTIEARAAKTAIKLGY